MAPLNLLCARPCVGVVGPMRRAPAGALRGGLQALRVPGRTGSFACRATERGRDGEASTSKKAGTPAFLGSLDGLEVEVPKVRG